MTFINPNIASSYRNKAMGQILYDAVIKSNAKIIIDIGLFDGYSTVCLALAAQKTGGIVYAYDLFDDYEYARAKIDIVNKNLKKYSVDNIVHVKKLSFNDWIERKEKFDILHVDISNTGETIEKLYKEFKEYLPLKRRIFFEGGSKERDEQDWMIKYNMKKFSETNIPYKVLKKDAYNTNDGRIYYPCISELGKTK